MYHHSIIRPVFLTVSLFVFSALFVTQPILSQEEGLDPAADLTLFITEAYLTIYVSSDDTVSLEDFELAIASPDGDGAVTFTPQIRFAVLQIGNNRLQSGVCLVYHADTDSAPPEVCNENSTFFSEVGPGDRFWFDDEEARRDVFIFRDGTNTSEACQAQREICPIFYNSRRPLEEVEDVRLPAFFEPRNVREQVASTLKKSSVSGMITDLIWRPDGRMIISSHENGDICLWDPQGIASEAISCEQNAHQGQVTALTALMVQAERDFAFASTGTDGVVRLWEVRGSDLELVEEATQEIAESLRDIQSNPANTSFIVSDENRPVVRDFNDPETNEIYNTDSSIGVGWHGDGRYAVTLSETGVIRVIDTTGEEQFVTLGSLQSDGVDIVWNERFDQIAATDIDGTVQLYEYIPGSTCEGGQCPSINIAQNLRDATQLAFSPTGNALAISQFGRIQTMNVQSAYQLVDTYIPREATPNTVFTAVEWSPDERRLVGGDNQGNIHIWEVENSSSPRIVELEQWLGSDNGEVIDMTWHPDGRAIAVVDIGLELSVWSPNGEQIGQSSAHTRTPLGIDWNQNQTELVATGGCGPSAIVWRFTASPAITLPVPFDEETCVRAIAFNSQGDRLVTADQRGILRVWDWSNELQMATKTLQIAVNDIEWNGTNLASVDNNGVVTVFDMIANEQPIIFQRETGVPLSEVSWSPDGTRIATGLTNGSIAIWEWENAPVSGQRFQNSYIIEDEDAPIVSVDWSRDNNLLLSVNRNNKIVIWDALNGQRLAEFYTENTPTGAMWVPVASVPVFAVTDRLGYITIYEFGE